MHGVHFRMKWKVQRLEIGVCTSLKNSTVRDLGFMAFARFELYFPFQVNAAGSEESLINVGINSPDGKTKFRMVCDDLVR